MGRLRESLSELELRGSPNLSRALKLRAISPDTLTKVEDIEKLFADTQKVYERARTNVEERGEILTVTRYTSKGKAYHVEQVNPYLRVMQKAAAQLATLAKLLGKGEPPKPKTQPTSALDKILTMHAHDSN